MLALTTFGRSVTSIVPGGYEAYARVFHPIRWGAGDAEATTTWREMAAKAGRSISDLTMFKSLEVERHGVFGQPANGDLAPEIITAMIPHLRDATTTANECYFALWEGWAGTIPHERYEPTLWLPARAYHVFRGEIDAALFSFSLHFGEQSANLWWPADRAWCVASEIDFQWSYVGGPRSCIDAILRDPRIESTEVSEPDAPFRR
jgi:hypothetical protein